MTAAVAEQLGDPPDLVFPANGLNNVTRLGEERYQITSYAEYTGKKGTPQRTYFFGVVILEDNSWTIERIKFAP